MGVCVCVCVCVCVTVCVVCACVRLSVPISGEDREVIKGRKVRIRREILEGIVHADAIPTPRAKHFTCVHGPCADLHSEANLHGYKKNQSRGIRTRVHCSVAARN